MRERTGGRGVDFCLESVGGDVLARALEVLAPLGRIVLLGFSSIDSDHSERIARVHPLTLFHRSIGIFGLNVENLDFPRRAADWRALCEVAERHDLRPVVGPRFPLERAADAHAAIEARSTVGKVLLVP